MYSQVNIRLIGIVILAIVTLILTTCGKNTRPADETSAFLDDSLRVLNGSIDVDVYPEMIHHGIPHYPSLAKQAGVTGTVWVRALVDKSGSVAKSEIARSSGTSSLDREALAAAHKCKFKPGIKDGQPVECWITYKVDFDLD